MTGDRYDACSVGTRHIGVNPFAIKAMSEIGIDISGQLSKSVEVYFDQNFDYVITLCQSAQRTCPFFPGETAPLHWDLGDAAAARGSDADKMAMFRKIRDELKTRSSTLFLE
jgi:arsenate reductase